MLAISSLSIVDFVVPSDYPTAIKNIELIKPNFYVKGPDYKNSKDITDNLDKERKSILKCGGRIEYTSGITFSSSSIINKIENKFNKDQIFFLKQIKNKYSFSYIEKMINKISNLTVNIFGEIIIDQYISCEPIGISGKDPFLVFNKKAESRYPGGSFAIAKNVSDFSKKTNLISIFSKKPIKDYLIKNKDKNLFLDLVFNKKGTDILKNRYLDINTNTKLFGLYSLNQDQISNVLEKKILKLLINRKKNNYFIIKRLRKIWN
jgi:bifunctional ADP-heptose synthase (sugar kinase/adenylyltransferase)